MPGVHFEFTEEHPSDIQEGDWLLWVSEDEDSPPQMAQVQRVLHERGEWRLATQLGMLVAQEHELVKRIA